jgi:hypothetical protein
VKSEWCRTVGLTKSAGLLIYHAWPPEIQFYNLRSFETGTAFLRHCHCMRSWGTQGVIFAALSSYEIMGNTKCNCCCTVIM